MPWPSWGAAEDVLSFGEPTMARRWEAWLSFVLAAGQARDSPQFRTVLSRIKVDLPIGRPRTRPGTVAADKAYSSRANRSYLRRQVAFGSSMARDWGRSLIWARRAFLASPMEPCTYAGPGDHVTAGFG